MCLCIHLNLYSRSYNTNQLFFLIYLSCKFPDNTTHDAQGTAALGQFIEGWSEDANWNGHLDITNMISNNGEKWGISLVLHPNANVDLRDNCNDATEPYIWSLRFEVTARFDE